MTTPSDHARRCADEAIREYFRDPKDSMDKVYEIIQRHMDEHLAAETLLESQKKEIEAWKARCESCTTGLMDAQKEIAELREALKWSLSNLDKGDYPKWSHEDDLMKKKAKDLMKPSTPTKHA